MPASLQSRRSISTVPAPLWPKREVESFDDSFRLELLDEEIPEKLDRADVQQLGGRPQNDDRVDTHLMQIAGLILQASQLGLNRSGASSRSVDADRN